MRCPKCNTIYEPSGKSRACPHCGHEPPRASRRSRSRAGLQRELDGRLALVTFLLAFLVLPILTILSGQLLLGGGSILLVLGMYTLAYGCWGRFANLVRPWAARTTAILSGLAALGLAAGCFTWFFLSGAPWPPPAVLADWRRMDVRFDYSGLAVPLCLGAAAAAAYALDRWLARRETAARQRDWELGELWPIRPLARVACLFVLLMIGVVGLALGVAALNAEDTGVRLEAGLGVPLLLLPAALCIYLLIHNSGHVVLTEEAVLLGRGRRVRRMPYREIVEIRTWRFGLLPAMVLVGRDRKLVVPRSVEHLPQLYTALLARAGLPPQESVPQPESQLVEPSTFPCRLGITARSRWFHLLVTLLLAAVYLALFLLSLWVGSLWILVLASLLLIPAVAAVVVSTLRPGEPYVLELTAEALRYRLPLGRWHSRAAGELKTIYLEPTEETVHAWASGIPSHEQNRRYRVILEFARGSQLTISEERARHFGLTPEQLYVTLARLYGRAG